MTFTKGRRRDALKHVLLIMALAVMALLSVCEAFVARLVPAPKASCTGCASGANTIISRPSLHDAQFKLLMAKNEGIDERNDYFNWKAPILSAVLAASLVVVVSASSPPAPAFAVVDPSIFTNDYADPLHPQCKRRIQVSRDGTTFHYSGTAVGPKDDDSVLRGCSPQEIKEFGIRRGQFDGRIIGDGKISAGDGIHEGVWEPAFSVTGQPFDDVDGIRWNDGNKWTVVKKSLAEQGAEYFFWTYITFSLAAGAKGLYDGIQRKRAESGQ